VFSTLTVLNLALGDWLRTLQPIQRTSVLASIAVPVISYILLSRVQRARTRLLLRLPADASPPPTKAIGAEMIGCRMPSASVKRVASFVTPKPEPLTE
jgi:hypothetical protein